MTKSEKIRENRLRRVADRQGYRLVKSRSRDPNAMDFGLYAVFDVSMNIPLNPSLAQRWTCSWDLDDVEEFLNRKE